MCVALSSHMMDSLLLTCRAIQAHASALRVADAFRIIIHLVLACGTGACVKAGPSLHDMVVCSMLHTWFAREAYLLFIFSCCICKCQCVNVNYLGANGPARSDVKVSRIAKTGHPGSADSR